MSYELQCKSFKTIFSLKTRQIEVKLVAIDIEFNSSTTSTTFHFSQTFHLIMVISSFVPLKETVSVISCDHPCKDGKTLKSFIWRKIMILGRGQKFESYTNIHPRVIFHILSDRGFKCTVVNQAVLSFHEGSLKITLTVSF